MEMIKNGIKIAARLIIITAAFLVYGFMFYSQGYEKAKEEAYPITLYTVDNAGGVMVGQITDKEIIEGRYTVTAHGYGKFLVTKEQYESLSVGDEIPSYLKERGARK